MKIRTDLTSSRSLARWTILGVSWLVAVSIGFAMLLDYASSPATTHPQPPQWPADSTLHLATRGATLILFAHPRCPCTRASLGELERIVAHDQGRVTCKVIFFKPDGAAGDWEQTDLWRAAQSIPGVQVVCDAGGEECRRFHATTSGETLLFSDQGELLFSGGITFSRGHAGDNAGRSAIESILAGGTPGYSQTSVFGCPIAAATGPN
jgi:hypothetical protein